MVGVRVAGGSREGKVAPSVAVCADCSDPGTVVVAGALYCDRCALRSVVAALRAEAGQDTSQRPGSPTLRS